MDKLLQIIGTNSQFSNAELAAMLGEPEDYIEAKIREYENKGIIKGYQAVVNWDAIDDSRHVEALIELKVSPQRETGFEEMAERCMAFEEVESLYLMAGVFDFAVIVKGETMQDIAMFVAKKLSTVDGVLSTATHFILRRYKDRGMKLVSENSADERSLIL
ncbi:MAG: Lrp/AsnC family transcriptional regulator [Ruminococcus sp.]|nr:Lrp/AsnC family transcriptional regulator [Ruminococcus sp.]